MIWTIPNILTLCRLVAAPMVLLAFLVFDRAAADWIAFLLFTGAALTDFFDGWLARRLGQITEIGKMLDPIADKAMVIIVLFALIVRETHSPNAPLRLETPDPALTADPMLPWIAAAGALIILRETLISGLREFLADHKLPVTTLAKWKTSFQMLALGGLLAIEPLRDVLVTFEQHFRGNPQATAKLVGDVRTFFVALLGIAAVLTAYTGWDYFRRGIAYIASRED